MTDGDLDWHSRPQRITFRPQVAREKVTRREREGEGKGEGKEKH